MARPGRTRHRAGRRVDEFAVAPAGPGVDDPAGVHLAGKIPGADQAIDRFARPHPGDIAARQRAREKLRILEAAVEGIDRRLVGPAGQAQAARTAGRQRRCRCRCRQGRQDGIGNGMRREGRHRQNEGALGRVHRQRDGAPGIQRDRPAGFNRGFARADPDPPPQGERRGEFQFEAAAALVETRQDDLATRHLQGRMQANRERAVLDGKRQAADPDHRIGAGWHHLRPRLDQGRHGQRHRFGDHAANLWVGIGADHPHDLRPDRFAGRVRHVEAKGLAFSGGQALRIAGQQQHSMLQDRSNGLRWCGDEAGAVKAAACRGPRSKAGQRRFRTDALSRAGDMGTIRSRSDRIVVGSAGQSKETG
jgi:hypothetical protein